MFASRLLIPKALRRMSTLQTISTKRAPGAIGPYSQAIVVNNIVYTSGQIPVDPATNELVENDVRVQTRQVLKNLSALLEDSGSGMNNVIKTTVFLKDMNDFVKMNEEYAKAFGDHRPARSAVEVARLPKDVLVEIECVALLKQ
ncbi:uncharacterized protein VTP21DRAFT_8072 [Calcarisporiella thermophila]|uniref:uncharacterized protein n=1 Tax=Calcarisporiella thermophila TaxID=911321 RepID=UPI00374370D2